VKENVIYFPKDGVNVEFSGTLPHMIHADSYIGLEFCIYNYKMTYVTGTSGKFVNISKTIN
jgi:RNase P/RNase MRP subunit p29